MKVLVQKREKSENYQRTIRELYKVIIIDELRIKYKFCDLLNFAKMPRSTFYYYLKNINKVDKYEKYKKEIFKIFHDNKGRYGYRRITMELKKSGLKLNHKTVVRLMKIMNLKSQVRIKKYKSYKGDIGRKSPNILERNFKAIKPNEKWVTDVTEFSLFGEKLYLSPILDLYNGEIV